MRELRGSRRKTEKRNKDHKVFQSHRTYKLKEHFCIFLRDLTIKYGKCIKCITSIT